MEKEKLIMFSWQNFYLTGIQAGIQSGHCWMDMASFYRRTENQPENITCPREAKAAEVFWDWADNHKVVNVRNGGEQEALRDIWALFSKDANPYPHCYFREDEGLNMALTNVSIVLPEKVFAHEPVEVEEPLISP